MPNSPLEYGSSGVLTDKNCGPPALLDGYDSDSEFDDAMTEELPVVNGQEIHPQQLQLSMPPSSPPRIKSEPMDADPLPHDPMGEYRQLAA
ncbi:hypothetical protein E8E11_004287 [Didymella keratinophila]|nr:hypothetical protein E8E11_004287 [Didymella keratinophila]